MKTIEINNLNLIDVTLPKCMQIIAKNVTLSLADSIENEYLNVIEFFYHTYTPKQYVRHADRNSASCGEPGLHKTYEKYYRNPHGVHYHGGITISTERMYTDYKGGAQDTLNSFLAGFHGPASGHIPMPFSPLTHMITYQNVLTSNIDTFVDAACRIASQQMNITIK